MPDTQKFPVLSAPVSRDPGSATRSEGGMEPSGLWDIIKTVGGHLLGI